MTICNVTICNVTICNVFCDDINIDIDIERKGRDLPNGLQTGQSIDFAVLTHQDLNCLKQDSKKEHRSRLAQS